MASDHGCPIEMHQIKIDKCDEMYDENCQGDTTMPFHRARYDPSTGQSPNNPREQVNIKYMINRIWKIISEYVLNRNRDKCLTFRSIE